MPPPYRVAIVVDREFGSRVAELAKRVHVWLCDSPLNRPAAEALWHAPGGDAYDLETGVTLFDCPPDQPVEDALVHIVGTVDQHHGQHAHDPPWSVIEVIGCPATPRVRRAFAEFYAQITPTSLDRFEARRPSGAV